MLTRPTGGAFRPCVLLVLVSICVAMYSDALQCICSSTLNCQLCNMRVQPPCSRGRCAWKQGTNKASSPTSSVIAVVCDARLDDISLALPQRQQHDAHESVRVISSYLLKDKYRTYLPTADYILCTPSSAPVNVSFDRSCG